MNEGNISSVTEEGYQYQTQQQVVITFHDAGHPTREFYPKTYFVRSLLLSQIFEELSKGVLEFSLLVLKAWFIVLAGCM